jgi:hypothetical protein
MAADPWEIDRLDLRTKSVEPDDGESLLAAHALDILRYSLNLVEEVFSEVAPSGLPLCPFNQMWQGYNLVDDPVTEQPQHLTLIFDGN